MSTHGRFIDRGVSNTNMRLDPINAARIESSQFVVNVNEPAVSPKKSDERILLTDVMLQPQNSNRSILSDEPGIRGELLLRTEISRAVIRR